MLTPEKYAKPDSEHSQQVALMMWVHSDGMKLYPLLDLLHAIPNGGERARAVAGRMKAEGVRKGVSDLFLPVARQGCHGLYIEMKKPDGGKVSKEQQDWIDSMHGQGYGACVCWSWAEARDVLLQYMG